MLIRREDQRSVSRDDETEQRMTASIKRSRSLSYKVISGFALSVALLFILTAFSPLTSAQGIDLVTKDASLNDAKITNVMKLDAKDTLNKASNGDAVSLLVNGSNMSFKLREGSLLAPNFRATFPGGTSLGVSDGITIPRFFSGEDSAGNSVQLTMAGEWMHYSVQTNKSSYSIDSYDGTGASGYYAVSNSGPSPASVAHRANDALQRNQNEAVDAVNESLDNITVASNASDAVAPSSIGSQGLEASMSSGTEQELSTNEMSLQTSAQVQPKKVLVNIYMVADYDFTRLSEWAYRMYSELWDVHGQYESQANVSFQAVGLGQDVSNYCNSTDSSQLWTQFNSYLNNQMTYPTSSDWNVAHLFSGKTLTTAGGNYCTYPSGAGIAKLRNDPVTYKGYGCSVSQQTYSGNNENEFLLGFCIGVSLNGDNAYAGTNSDWMSSYNSNSALYLNNIDRNRIQTFAQQVCDRSKTINYGGSDEHWNGLYMTNLFMITTDVPTVGKSVSFSFTVYNDQPRSIDLAVLCVGGRDAKGNIKDFGTRTNVHINASGGSPYFFENTSRYGFDSGGTWTLFPSAYYGGQYSPYEWLVIYPTVYYCINSWHRTSTPSEFTTNDLFYQWGIYATSPFVGPGSNIMASFTMFSKAGGTGFTNYNWIFAEVRDPQNVCRDFGCYPNQVLSNGGFNSLLGGGLHEEVTTTLNGNSGVWKIGPCYQIAGQDWGPWMEPQYVKVGIIVLHYGTDHDSSPIDNGHFQIGSGTTCTEYLHPDNTMGLSLGVEVTSLFWSSQYNCPFMTLSVASIWNKGLLGYPYLGGNWAREESIYVGKEQNWDAGIYANETNANIPRNLGSAASVSGADVYYQIGGYNTAIGNDFVYPTGNPQQEAITDVAIATTMTALALAFPVGTIGAAITTTSYVIALLQAGAAFTETGSFIHESSFNDASAASVKWTGVDDRYQQEQSTYNEVNLRLGGGSQQTYCFSIWADFKPNQNLKSTPSLILYLVP